MNWMPSIEVRKWIYGIATVILPLLVAYGLLDERTAPLWIAVVGAVLVPGLAFVNTNPPPKDGGDDVVG